MQIRDWNPASPKNHLIVGSFASLFGNIILWPLLARSSSLAELGTLSISLAIAATLAPLLLLGNNVTALVKKDATSESKKVTMSTGGLVSLWKMILLVTFILALFSIFSSKSHVSLVAYCVSQSGFILSVTLLRRFEYSFHFLIFNIFTQFFGSLILAFLVEWHVLQIVNFLIALSIWHLTCQMILYYRIRADLNFSFELKHFFGSVGLIPHLILYVVTVQGGKYLVSIRLGPEELGRYQILSVYAAGLLTLAIVSSPYLFDKFSLSNPEESQFIFDEIRLKIQRFVIFISFCTLMFLLISLKMYGNQTNTREIIGIHICFFLASIVQIRTETYSIVRLKLAKYTAMGVSSLAGVSISLLLMFLIKPSIMMGSYFVGVALLIKMLFLRYLYIGGLKTPKIPLLDWLVTLSLLLLFTFEVISN